MKLNDSKSFTNNDVIDFTLGQHKIRSLFTKLTKADTHSLTQALNKSVKSNGTFENVSQCIRLLAHLLYEGDNEFESATVELLYQTISKLAFEAPQVVGV